VIQNVAAWQATTNPRNASIGTSPIVRGYDKTDEGDDRRR
jgi:hypothetical protein